ncbi:MAG TPA: hypothetical protein VET23_11160 [Chitinophagaceae bacterium]|nr:hypothetical protein [Chitinophagaceae bacterium]
MKTILKLFIPLFFPCLLLASTADTTVQGVQIETNYSPAIFPKSWQDSPVNATGEQITPGEWRRAEMAIIKALKKYPKDMLTLNLKAVYLLKSMSFYNVGFGGTNSSDAVYVTNNGESQGYTDAYLEQTFHHEFSSILFRNYPSLLDTTTWKLQNDPGFDYNDPENGVGALKNHESSQALDTLLAKKGMLTQYAMSSLENDLNTLAQNLFRPAENFWSIVDHFPKVRAKVKLLIAFYNHLSPVFTENYFRSFDKPNS